MDPGQQHDVRTNHGGKGLIVGPAWVGDMVMAHSLVQLLSRRYESLHMLAPPATAPVASRMAEIESVHVADFVHGEFGFAKRRQMGRALKAHGFAAAYVLPNSWKSGLVPLLAQIPQRTGWLGESRYVLLNDHRKLDANVYPLMIERFMALAEPDGALPEQPYPLPQLRVDEARCSELLSRFKLAGNGPVLGLCPGAEFGQAKKWPVSHYAEIAARARDAGWSVWLLGSAKDRDDCEAIARVVSSATNLAGQTRLDEAIDLLSRCRQVVCNDSGLMHVSCALNVPTLGIFGSTSPGFTPPLGNTAMVAEIDLECRPCFQRECPLGHLDCLRQLSPDHVWRMIEANVRAGV